ncbi:MAG: peptigoglycan-binding protein LysM [Gammaproteobacteria bacterium HGW-Gammaproteobacteria-14]|nr:MAG: peptigoglycan-binding protein LysM [Gammaproteobacteria bacterium HGW-Gammaproteobacteria-14]
MLAPSLAAALGVGDYRLNSFLNQPLDMEVELIDVRDLAAEEILASIAAEREFETAGVERVFFLNELQFEVVIGQGGNATLKITSRQPVREPFLNFIVELMWPTGRLLREYTVLLDPPTFTEPVTKAPAPAASTPAVTPAPAAPAQRPVQQAPVHDSSRGPDYVVRASDTMWRIALDNRPANSISVQQMLIAIQTLNPDAFIDGNVNLVREGTVLRMPSEQDIRQISTRQAIAEVAEQNREWRAKLEARGIAVPSRTQLDGTSPERRGTGVGVAGEGQVTLVSPGAASGEGDGRGTSGTARDTSALQNELTIRDENVERLARENRELSSRLRDLQEQASTSDRLMKLRNDQIAQLQAQLAELQRAQGITPTTPVVIEPVVEAPPVPVTADGDDAVEVVEADEVIEGDAVTEESAVEPEAEVVETTPVVREQVRPVTPEAPAPASLTDTLFANLPLIGGLLVVLAALGGGLLWMRKRREQAEEAEAAELYDEDQDVGGDDDFFAAAGDFTDDEEVDEAETAPEAAQDPLEEVDVYTAYGRHAEAVSFLRNEVHKAPQRQDLKVRLLEVLSEMRDQQGFEQEAANFAGSGSQVDEAIASLKAGFGGDLNEPSLDDLEMDLTADLDAPAAPEPKAAADDMLTLDPFDADLDDDGLGEFELDIAEEPAKKEDDTLTLSLDDDELSLDDTDVELSLEEDDSPVALSLDDDDELSLDLDEPEAEDDSLSLEYEAPAKPVTSSLSLDDVSADLTADPDFGELSLDDMSDEFSDAAEKSSPEEELDLSLDDLELDMDEAPTEVSMPALDIPEEPASTAQSTVQRDSLELDEELNLDEVTATDVRPAVEPALEQELGADDDFDFLGDTDENATKLDLAKAYIDMGDADGAKEILQEVISEGNPQQQQEAKELLTQVG